MTLQPPNSRFAITPGRAENEGGDGYVRFPTLATRVPALAIAHYVRQRGAAYSGELLDVFLISESTRFKHIYAQSGIPYLDSEDLFKINPELTKFIPSVRKQDADTYYVQAGWLLMACSGQLYGLNGSVVLANRWHENKIVSNHVLRIIAGSTIRPGYLQMALSHPVYGRPLVLSLAFGSEVPEIAPEDVRDFPVVRLDDATEAAIAANVEKVDALRLRAQELEDEAVVRLEQELGERPTTI